MSKVLGESNTFDYKIQVDGMAASGVKVVGGHSTTDPSDQPPTARSGIDYYMAATYLKSSYTLAK